MSKTLVMIFLALFLAVGCMPEPDADDNGDASWAQLASPLSSASGSGMQPTARNNARKIITSVFDMVILPGFVSRSALTLRDPSQPKAALADHQVKRCCGLPG